MKALKLDFDTTKLKLKGEPPENITPTATELTRRIVGNMIYLYAEQNRGITKIERKQTYILQEILQGASDKKLKDVEIPDDVFGFLRKVFRDTRATPDLILQQVEANIDAVKME